MGKGICEAAGQGTQGRPTPSLGLPAPQPGRWHPPWRNRSTGCHRSFLPTSPHPPAPGELAGFELRQVKALPNADRWGVLKYSVWIMFRDWQNMPARTL